jgi:hypothetical protein
MSSPKKKQRKRSPWAWIRWFLFSESLILLLALAGPGYRYTIHERDDHALFARLFFDEPTYLQAVFVNFVVGNLLVFGALFAAWIIPRLRK